MLVVVVLTIALSLCGCGGGKGNIGDSPAGNDSAAEESAAEDIDEDEGNESTESSFSGTTKELLQNIIEESNALPEVVIESITPENAPAMLGLLADDFVSFIEEASAAAGESDMIAFQAAVILCKDANDADMIDGLIQMGFDPGKWVYVFPDRALTVVSKPYIMLVSGSIKETESLTESFKKAIGGSSVISVFYRGETGG